MRLGRILLALLAPLVSYSPALNADLAASDKPAAADSLTGLLRAAVPMATVLVVETGHSDSGHGHRVFTAGFAPHIVLPPGAVLSPAAEAAVRLLTRQQLRVQLRC